MEQFIIALENDPQYKLSTLNEYIGKLSARINRKCTKSTTNVTSNARKYKFRKQNIRK
jgi:hypothetical protein